MMSASNKTRPAIRIAHIHVWDKNNKGDLGIVLAVQEQLRAAWPQAKIMDFPVEVLKKYDVRQATRLNRADLIVLGGGGIFYSYFLPFDKKMIGAIKKPLVIYGAGYIREVGAKMLTATALDSLLYLINKVRLVGVRENYTRKFLVKYGVPTKKIRVVGDPALCLSEINWPADNRSGLMEHNLAKAEKRSRVNLNNKLPAKLKVNETNFKVGLNLNYSGWLGFGQWHDDILKAYREVAEFFQKNYGAQIYYLKHHPGEDNIYPALKIKNLKVIDFEPHQQKGFYGTLDLVVGMMLHSCVMAVGAGTPEINVAYDLRNRNFARFIGCPELVVELPELASGELLKRAQKVLKNSNDYRQRFTLIHKRVNNRLVNFMQEIKNNLSL